jgi:hypothetical protein
LEQPPHTLAPIPAFTAIGIVAFRVFTITLQRVLFVVRVILVPLILLGTRKHVLVRVILA